MSVRKGSIGGGGSGPRGEAVNKRASPTANDAEYLAAVAVLNEDTMAEACALLLSEKDFNSKEDDTGHKKLLAIFDKCLAASKVVEKRVPAVMMPTLVPQQAQRGPPNTAARTQAIPLKPKPKTIIPPRRTAMSARPSTKIAGSVPGGSHSFGPPPARGRLQRDASDSSFASNSSVGSGRSAKKARISPPALDTQTDTGKVKAPPPSAMSFLAALNKQGGKDEDHEPREKPAPKKKDSPTKSREAPPSAAAGTRKQPSRSSRRG